MLSDAAPLELGPYVVFSALRSSNFNTLAMARKGAAHFADRRRRFTATTAEVAVVTFGETDLLWLSFFKNLQLLDAAHLGGAPTYRRADAARVVRPPPELASHPHLEWHDPLTLFGNHSRPIGTFVALVQLRLSPLLHLASTSNSRREHVLGVARRLMGIADPRPAAPSSWPACSAHPAGSLASDLSTFWAQDRSGVRQDPVQASLFLGLDRSELYVLLRARQVDTISKVVHVIRALRVGAVGHLHPERFAKLTKTPMEEAHERWSSLGVIRRSHTLIGIELTKRALTEKALATEAMKKTRVDGKRDWRPLIACHLPEGATPETEPVGRKIELRGRIHWTPDGGGQVWDQLGRVSSSGSPHNSSRTHVENGVPHVTNGPGTHQERGSGRGADATPSGTLTPRTVFGSAQVAVTWTPTSSASGPLGVLTLDDLLQRLLPRIIGLEKGQHEGHATTELELPEQEPSILGTSSDTYPRFRARCLELADFRCRPHTEPDTVKSWVQALRDSAGAVRLNWGLKHRLIDTCISILARLGDDPVVAAVALKELEATIEWLREQSGMGDLVSDSSEKNNAQPFVGPTANRPVPVHRRRRLALDDHHTTHRLQLLADIFQGLASGSMAQSMLGSPTTDGHSPTARQVGGRYVIDAHVALAQGLGASVGLTFAAPLIRWSHRTRARAMLGHAGSILLDLPAGDRLEVLDLGVAPAITGAVLATVQFKDFSKVATDPTVPEDVREGAQHILRAWDQLSRSVGNFVPSHDASLGALLSAVGPRLVPHDARTEAGKSGAPTTDLRYPLRRLSRGLPALLGHHLLDSDPLEARVDQQRVPDLQPGMLHTAAVERIYFLCGPVAIRELLAEQGMGSLSHDSVAAALLGVLLLSWLVDRRTLRASERPRFDQCLEFVEHTLSRTAAFERALDPSPFEAPKLIDPQLVDRIVAIGQDLGLAGGEGLLIPAQELHRALVQARESPGDRPTETRPFDQRLAAWLELVDALTLDHRARPTIAAATRVHFGHEPIAPPESRASHTATARRIWRRYVDNVRREGGQPTRGWLPFTDRPNPAPFDEPGLRAEFTRLEARTARRVSGARLLIRSGGRTMMQAAPTGHTLIDSTDEQELFDALSRIGGPGLSDVLADQLTQLDNSAPDAPEPDDLKTAAAQG